MATPPTRVSYNTPASGNFSTSPTSFTTNSFNVTAGDVIVVLASAEHAGTIVTVTPSASGGSVTWTSRAQQPASATSAQSLARCWTGVVGATATGITVTLNRICASGAFWGMSASVYTAHGGVGAVFSGNNGTGSGAPSVAATCSANSAVLCQVNDWNAADGTSRTWRTINGAAETETVYFRNSSVHTVYGGYRADTGAAGSITQGLTTPSTMRYVLVGVEILGTTGGGGVSGDSTETITSSVTTAGTKGLVGNNTTTVTSSVSADATKGLVTGSTETVTASVSASGAVGLAQGASASTTSSITTSGSVGGTSPSGDSTVTETTSISSAGTVGKVGSATSSTTSSVSTGAVVGKVAGSSETVTSSISTSGSVISGLSGDSTRATTTSVTTTGAVGRASGATPSVSIDIAAAGSAGYSQVAALTTASSIVASGSLFSPQYRVVFPTHEEPMRTEIDFLRNHHLTHTLSIAKVNGEWRSIRATAIPESVLDELIDGSTLFVGGYDYVVDQATSDELTAAGFPTIPEDS